MNTTMADGAEQRLVAQIGEALFGQPGLTLMELAEKVKASQPTPSSRWAANGEPDPHGNRYDCERAALAMGYMSDDELANEVFIKGDRNLTFAEMTAGELPASSYLLAARDRIRWLSRALVEAQPKSAAQPSPRGQGDALAMIGANLRSIMQLATVQAESTNNVTVANIHTEARHALQLLESALAARQPVGEPVSEAWIVVKQHVWDHGDGGRPTLAYLWPSEFECRVYPSFEAASAFIKEGDWPLGFVAMQIQAPPAQAVDLGQFRQAVLDQFELVRSEETMTRPGRLKMEAALAERDRLLALIDSRDPRHG